MSPLSTQRPASEHRTLSVDPGVHHYGFALWRGDKLDEALLVERVTDVLDGILVTFSPHVVVIERPQIYRTSKNPNDLGELALAAGEMGGFASALVRSEIQYVYPAAWKGALDKAETQRRIEEALTADERAAIKLPPQKSLAHNIYDSVGLGLVHLGRASRGVIAKKRKAG